MNDLTALNTILRLTGNGTVNAVGQGDLQANEALVTLAQTRIEVLTEGWHFNTLEIDLPLDPDGRVPLNANYLDIRLPRGFQQREIDGQLFVFDRNANDFHDQAMTNIEIVFDFPEGAQFQLIPEHVARYIAYKAAEVFWMEKNPKEPNAQIAKLLRAQKMDALNTEPEASINRTSGWNARRASYTRGGFGRSSSTVGQAS